MPPTLQYDGERLPAIEDRQVLALSNPFGDIERLSIHPVKWLRYVIFAICGVRGDLSTTPNGPPVDYDSISLIFPKLTTILLRVISTDPIFVAYRKYLDLRPYRGLSSHRLHDQFTSEQTLHSSHFRSDVMVCDGPACVFTWTRGETCDAAHLLAKSKGDEVYISRHYSIPLPC